MAESKDRWAKWILETRYGGDRHERQRVLDYLAPVRDRVLDNGRIQPGDVVLDVGAGDGLIAFGALDHVGESGTVILSDISHDLLAHSAALAESIDQRSRCRFLECSADHLPLADGSVDVVTTRSVLIYLPAADKRRAVAGFHRLLRPGGRISLFEPINSFAYPEPDHLWCGFDVTPVKDLAAKVRGCAAGDQQAKSHPLLDFDERDLLEWIEEADLRRFNSTMKSRSHAGPRGPETGTHL